MDTLADTLQGLGGGDTRLDRATVASGLRRMADAFDGKVDEDDEDAGQEIVALASALEEVGRGITGQTREREDRETEDRIRDDAYDSIAAALAAKGLDDL